jgi:glycosyltransferase involved in cell wall biosynthesis
MILVDATPLQSEHRLRGVGSYLRHLIAAIERSSSANVHYLVSSVDQDHTKDFLPEERTHVMWRLHRPAQVYWSYNELSLRLALALHKPKSFLAPDFNGLVVNPYGVTTAILHDLTALKLNEPAPITNPSVYLSNLRWRVYARKLRAAKQIIAISNAAKRDAVKLLGLSEAKIHVVHHGVDHTHYRDSVGKGKFAQMPSYFLHLGGLNSNKNQTHILEAFASLAGAVNDIHLYFAGPWNADNLAWLERQRSELNLGERVKHLGYVAYEDLPSLYGNALAFVFPSLEEGFGMPVLEAMASGAPVITSNCSSLPEVAGDAALLVDPYATTSILAAMKRILECPEERTRLRRLGFQHAARFTWEATAQQTLQIVGAK